MNAPAPGPPTEQLPNTPWGIEVDQLRRLSGRPRSECWDLVILKWLKSGDTRPLASYLAHGRVPGPGILAYIASMLHPAERTEKDIPYQLIAVSRTGKKGARRNPEDQTRDQLLFENYKKRLTDRQEAAGTAQANSLSKQVFAELSAEFSIPEPMIRRAVTRIRKLHERSINRSS